LRYIAESELGEETVDTVSGSLEPMLGMVISTMVCCLMGFEPLHEVVWWIPLFSVDMVLLIVPCKIKLQVHLRDLQVPPAQLQSNPEVEESSEEPSEQSETNYLSFRFSKNRAKDAFLACGSSVIATTNAYHHFVQFTVFLLPVNNNASTSWHKLEAYI
jgi:hypothetical protein